VNGSTAERSRVFLAGREMPSAGVSVLALPEKTTLAYACARLRQWLLVGRWTASVFGCSLVLMNATQMDERPLWSVPDVARRLGVSRHSIYWRIASGELEAYTVGETGTIRIPPRAVDELLKPTRREDGS
jgi:excisionase family DNA binding protein